jgi:hypothetical protein
VIQALKLNEEWWAVFILNPLDMRDRYMLSSPTTEPHAKELVKEFERLIALREPQVC